MHKFSLRFIAGKYEGGEFALPQTGEVLIGRSADLDIVLVEDMVSRKHARINIQDDHIFLTDLGSTNGTFVNGERISEVEIETSDRVLVGTSIMRVENQEQVHDQPDDAGLDVPLVASTPYQQQGHNMSGNLTDVPLPDLLQLFSSNKKTGVLKLKAEQTGEIYLNDGLLQLAKLTSNSAVSAQKSLCRMLGWRQGSFEFEATPQPHAVEQKFSGATEAILTESLRLNDEAQRVLSALPGVEATVVLAHPIGGRLRDLLPQELDTLQLALRCGTVQSTLDEADTADGDTLRDLHKLMSQHIIKVAAKQASNGS